MLYLEEDVNSFHREDYYLAQIASEIRKGNVVKPERVKLNDMILSFEEAKAQQVKDSKSAWGSILGIKMEG